MNFAGPAAYCTIYVAAAVEGEIVFAAASVLVAAGKLSPFWVFVAGALGAASGDQFYFYLFRGRANRWLARLRPIKVRHDVIVARVRRHQVPMMLALRFTPGLRIAIAAACAYAEVAPLRFSTLNMIAAFAWAGIMLALVTRVGPAALYHVGLTGIWGALVPAMLLLVFGWWLGHEMKNRKRTESTE